MKSSMKRWKRLVLVGMLAWVLLFLALFTYFTDSRVGEHHRLISLSHTDTRRLASVQGNHRTSSAAPDLASTDHILGSVEIQDADIDNLQTQEALSASESKTKISTAVGWRKNQLQVLNRPRRYKDETAEDLEEYYFSKSKMVVRQLWKGSVSAHMLSPRLQKAMKDYMNINKHHVAYKGRRKAKLSGRELLCHLKKHVQLQTLDGSEPPFSRMGWNKLVPKSSLEQVYGSRFHTCAVVTSAGAILNSFLGKEIDSHDAVLRFNTAPTDGYESDVGNKTTLRVINSQILANNKHQFNTSALYKGVTLVAWDPAPYTVNLQKWYENPDYNLFTPYEEHRRKNPSQPFYILHPRFIWQLWDAIQGNTQENIQPNPPSSGFIGIVLMMSLCEKVHVYEYIPSLRQTDLCHYHEQYYDAACTLGAYHPLLYEKMLVQRMNVGSERDLRKKGKVTLPGFKAFDCDP